MDVSRPGKGRLRVAVTGASGEYGKLLLPRLERDPDVESILVLDVARPEGAKVEFHQVDLTRHDAESELTDALAERPVDALYHLAFLFGPIRNGSLAHELEVIGTMNVLTAAGRARLPRLVVPSMTAVYGARGNNPALLREESPLQGCPHSRFVTDKVEVEGQVRAFRERHPEMRVLVLRFAPVLGPTIENPVTRLLTRTSVVPTLLGFDPLWQGLHEEDAGRALHLSLRADVSGEFNIVGRGVLPLSGLIRQAGARPLPLPGPLFRGALHALDVVGADTLPVALLDYIHYSWVADGARAETALGFIPFHHVRDAAAALKRS
ncbi:SDR family oxidoreductase [Myxococcus sp. CA051A]|uniref:SDR family oxidoreductase n=1 Tax=Myxococcus llanfairpwllgwyngyllgogerychwyrndrobwllllantysiliogogogochensis TaxID=2590453 RepID=A0A540WML3_9BACT|nr:MULTISPECIES: SDR family oxidoreductase [Myxococcus]NTX02324.1 SDR family oxidoreductase [Myxococcus sp. CA040A]NTX37121.1 SDR family oxidoreductase [Myxococcus sp. CA033]NTX57814.1 SDR family oxidoreductase [Myxococcus sp. CA039A]NTX63959.1 SDR family oxidoreductase [Myxococcus sp. CA051A]TQF10256.1 SDR family oxidoreductase [Myxococcus llanfairpwllgwyngyllgogerychwyrndrobwllllantysiliogogogochensis]